MKRSTYTNSKFINVITDELAHYYLYLLHRLIHLWAYQYSVFKLELWKANWKLLI